MSENPNSDELVIPTESNSINPDTTVNPSVTDTRAATNIIGKISQTIGTGENAKNSIVWMTITWSLIIATGLSSVLLIFLGISFFQGKDQVVPEFTKNIISVWSIFTPIITLALGYAFGRNETK